VYIEFDSRLVFTFPARRSVPLPHRSPMSVAGRRSRPGRKESHPMLARLPRASMGQVFLLTPPKSFHLEPLLSRQYFASISPLTATLTRLLASVANKRLTAWLSPLDATLTKNRGYILPAKILSLVVSPSSVPYLVTSLLPYFARRSWRGRILGQRAKTEVVRPPRGVNSPRTTHHSGRTAATMSRRILLTAFS